ncbi:MAG: ABC transporter permease [Thermoplasmata archaeon]
MDMKRYIAKRAFWGVISLVGLSIFIFYLARILPGDPVEMMVDPRTPDAVVEQIRRTLGLHEPIYKQYFIWLKDILAGDFGYSIYSQRNLTQDIVEYLPRSLELIFVAAIFQIVGSFALGITAGSNINKWQDHATRIISYIGISVPAFVWAIIFQLVFAYYLGIFPTSGDVARGYIVPEGPTGFLIIDSLLTGKIGVLVSYLNHLFLPALALCIPGMAQVARIIRSGMTNVGEKEYISMAHAYGFPKRIIRYKYLLRPSIIPAITVLGMQLAMMLGNAFLVEKVFRFPGFSRFAVNAMLNNDLNTIVATVAIIGLIFFILNLTVDVIVAYVDPRIRYSDKG